MDTGIARIGDRVYFTKERTGKDDPPIQIIHGDVDSLCWEGTTNEYFNVKVVSALTGKVMTLIKPPAECFTTIEETRNVARVKIYEQLTFLHEQLTALGDHTYSPSRWEGDR